VKKYIRHSVACGLLARVIAAHLNYQQTEQMFTAGLLHDIGRLVIYKYFPDQALAFLYQAQENNKSLLSAEKSVPGLQHTAIGKALLEKWKLPLTLLDIVRSHHAPSNAKNPDKAAVVHVADIMANALGLGTSGECFIPAFDASAWQRLGLSTAALSTISEQVLHSMTSIESFFGV
jgi:putative nucleotidyltransferase with HDIG domain